MKLDPAVVVSTFLAWKDRWFKPGVVERCADFIRTVFREELGWDPPVTVHPLDYEAVKHVYPEPPGPDAAASLSGPEIGMRVDIPAPGDLVFFRNTYPGFPPGCITHVGLYVGEGMMVDRPTASKPVQHRPVTLFDYTGWPPVYVRPRAYKLLVAGEEKVEGKVLGTPVPAFMRIGKVQLAVRPAAAAAGWQAEPVVGGRVLLFVPRECYPHGTTAFSLPLTIIDGQGFVPARELAAGLGLVITWDPAKRLVELGERR